METQGDCNNTPDSWDQQEDSGSGDQDPAVQGATTSLSGLNVNASPFVPGQNPFAKEFVMPSFNPSQNDEDAGDTGKFSRGHKTKFL